MSLNKSLQEIMLAPIMNVGLYIVANSHTNNLPTLTVVYSTTKRLQEAAAALKDSVPTKHTDT